MIPRLSWSPDFRKISARDFCCKFVYGSYYGRTIFLISGPRGFLGALFGGPRRPGAGDSSGVLIFGKILPASSVAISCMGPIMAGPISCFPAPGAFWELSETVILRMLESTDSLTKMTGPISSPFARTPKYHFRVNQVLHGASHVETLGF